MSLNRWKLVAGVLGLGMCGIAALAEPACRNTSPVNARMPEEKKPEVPLKGSKPNLELPKLPEVSPSSKGDESLPLPGPTKPAFPAVSELPVPGALPPVNKLPEFVPVANEKTPVIVPFAEAKNLAVPKAVEPLPAPSKPDFPMVNELPRIDKLVNSKDELPLPAPNVEASKTPLPVPGLEKNNPSLPVPVNPATPTFAEVPMPILPTTKMSDPIKIAEEFNKLPPLPDSVATPKFVAGQKLETNELVLTPPPPALPATFTPPPIAPVQRLEPPVSKSLPAAIEPPQLTPRVVVEEPTPLRPVSVEKKLRVQLNLGSGKPWLEIRDNEELVLKVVAEAVEVKAVGEGTEGLNVLKATGGVTFRTLGGNGTCDELRVVPGTGEVQLSGKVVVTSNWGKAETTATAEKMTFRLGSEPVNKK